MTTTARHRAHVARWNLHRVVERHPLVTYFALAYLISWPLWLLSRAAGGAAGTVLLAAGGFGPAVAALLTVTWSGRSVRTWLRTLLRWRAPTGAWVYALALPVVVMVLFNLLLAGLGLAPDWASLPGRAPGYLATFLVTALVFGGQEELGWRGFALGELQRGHRPVVATALLGLGWGLWHVPLYGPGGLVVPLVLAFFYTWLFNASGSVLLCVLLHAGLTAGQDHLLLTADSPVVDATLLATYLAAAAVLLLLTRERLGLKETHPAGAAALSRRSNR